MHTHAVLKLLVDTGFCKEENYLCREILNSRDFLSDDFNGSSFL